MPRGRRGRAEGPLVAARAEFHRRHRRRRDSVDLGAGGFAVEAGVAFDDAEAGGAGLCVFPVLPGGADGGFVFADEVPEHQQVFAVGVAGQEDQDGAVVAGGDGRLGDDAAGVGQGGGTGDGAGGGVGAVGDGAGGEVVQAAVVVAHPAGEQPRAGGRVGVRVRGDVHCGFGGAEVVGEDEGADAGALDVRQGAAHGDGAVAAEGDVAGFQNGDCCHVTHCAAATVDRPGFPASGPPHATRPPRTSPRHGNDGKTRGIFPGDCAAGGS